MATNKPTTAGSPAGPQDGWNVVQFPPRKRDRLRALTENEKIRRRWLELRKGVYTLHALLHEATGGRAPGDTELTMVGVALDLVWAKIEKAGITRN
jgi:hypothetical protein